MYVNRIKILFKNQYRQLLREYQDINLSVKKSYVTALMKKKIKLYD